MVCPSPSSGRQGGAAVLILLTLLLMAGLSYVVYRLPALLPANLTTTAAASAERKTLQQAQAALLAWSATGGKTGTTRPGELPCPDKNQPGSPNEGTQSSPCGAAGAPAVGRFPWKTLGFSAPLLDKDGEPLWYVLDSGFRNNTGVINSDSAPTLTAFFLGGTSLPAVAAVIAAGSALPGQSRSSGAEQTTASNYLETVGSPYFPVNHSNATPQLGLVVGPIKDATGQLVSNDLPLLLEPAQHYRVMELRVLTAAAQMLEDYRTTPVYRQQLPSGKWEKDPSLVNGNYPFPAKYDDPKCSDSSLLASSACRESVSSCRGRLPDPSTFCTTNNPTTDDCPPATDPAWPTSKPIWFVPNHWNEVLYYGVATARLRAAPLQCSPALTVDGQQGAQTVLFLPGPRGAGVIRPSTNLADYLGDTANQDGWPGVAPGADDYVTPSKASGDQLRVFY